MSVAATLDHPQFTKVTLIDASLRGGAPNEAVPESSRRTHSTDLLLLATRAEALVTQLESTPGYSDRTVCARITIGSFLSFEIRRAPSGQHHEYDKAIQVFLADQAVVAFEERLPAHGNWKLGKFAFNAGPDRGRHDVRMEFERDGESYSLKVLTVFSNQVVPDLANRIVEVRVDHRTNQTTSELGWTALFERVANENSAIDAKKVTRVDMFIDGGPFETTVSGTNGGTFARIVRDKLSELETVRFVLDSQTKDGIKVFGIHIQSQHIANQVADITVERVGDKFQVRSMDLYRTRTDALDPAITPIATVSRVGTELVYRILVGSSEPELAKGEVLVGNAKMVGDQLAKLQKLPEYSARPREVVLVVDGERFPCRPPAGEGGRFKTLDLALMQVLKSLPSFRMEGESGPRGALAGWKFRWFGGESYSDQLVVVEFIKPEDGKHVARLISGQMRTKNAETGAAGTEISKLSFPEVIQLIRDRPDYKDWTRSARFVVGNETAELSLPDVGRTWQFERLKTLLREQPEITIALSLPESGKITLFDYRMYFQAFGGFDVEVKIANTVDSYEITEAIFSHPALGQVATWSATDNIYCCTDDLSALIRAYQFASSGTQDEKLVTLGVRGEIYEIDPRKDAGGEIWYRFLVDALEREGSFSVVGTARVAGINVLNRVWQVHGLEGRELILSFEGSNRTPASVGVSSDRFFRGDGSAKIERFYAGTNLSTELSAAELAVMVQEEERPRETEQQRQYVGVVIEGQRFEIAQPAMGGRSALEFLFTEALQQAPEVTLEVASLPRSSAVSFYTMDWYPRNVAFPTDHSARITFRKGQAWEAVVRNSEGAEVYHYRARVNAEPLKTAHQRKLFLVDVMVKTNASTSPGTFDSVVELLAASPHLINQALDRAAGAGVIVRFENRAPEGWATEGQKLRYLFGHTDTAQDWTDIRSKYQDFLHSLPTYATTRAMILHLAQHCAEGTFEWPNRVASFAAGDGELYRAFDELRGPLAKLGVAPPSYLLDIEFSQGMSDCSPNPNKIVVDATKVNLPAGSFDMVECSDIPVFKGGAAVAEVLFRMSAALRDGGIGVVKADRKWFSPEFEQALAHVGLRLVAPLNYRLMPDRALLNLLDPALAIKTRAAFDQTHFVMFEKVGATGTTPPPAEWCTFQKRFAYSEMVTEIKRILTKVHQTKGDPELIKEGEKFFALLSELSPREFLDGAPFLFQSMRSYMRLLFLDKEVGASPRRRDAETLVKETERLDTLLVTAIASIDSTETDIVLEYLRTSQRLTEQLAWLLRRASQAAPKVAVTEEQQFEPVELAR